MRKLALVVIVCLFVAAGTVGAVEDKSNSPGPSNVGEMSRATGGPDDFGYVFSDNSEAGCTSLYSYVDITGTGTAAGLAGDDDEYAGPFPIGFSFDFYGTAYTDFFVGSNGVVYFEDDYLGLGNQCPIPAPTGYGPQIFLGPYQDDLEVLSSGDIFYETFADCPVGAGGQCTIIQFFDVVDYGGDAPGMDFEVVLYADGSIVYQYLDPSNADSDQTNGASATVGIQGSPDAAPEWALMFSCNTQSLQAGLAIAFAPPGASDNGVPAVCAVQQPTPTPSGPQPVPTASRSGLVLMTVLFGIVALFILRRKTA